MTRRRARSVRWLLALVALATALVLPVLMGQGVLAGASLFADDFEADTVGGPAAGWTVVAGQWAVALDGTQVLRQPDPSTSTSKSISAGSAAWTDYSVVAQVKPGSTASGTSNVLSARYHDDNNGYSLLIKDGNAWFFGKRVGGTWTTFGSGSFAYDTVTWHRFEIDLAGTSLTALIDGVRMSSATDSSLSAGAIDLKARATMEIDNVAVTSLGGPAPSPSPSATPTPTPTPSATPTPTPTPSASPTPTPSATPTPTPTPSPPPPPGPGGLFLTTQVRSGIVNGPANNQLETDVNWQDPASGDGWQVGIVPGYGGANVSFWTEISGGVAGTTQTALNTTTPSGLFHDLTDRNGSFVGSESGPFKSTELAPVGTAFRRGYLATVPPTGRDNNGFQHRVTSYVYPGDPGFLVQRFDIINPGTTAIPLSTTDSIEFALIGGLEQRDTTWAPGNGRLGSVGVPQTSWPSSLKSRDPDYAYITPAAGSGFSTAVLAVRKATLASLGLVNPQVQFLQNTHRLKIKVQGDTASVPAGAVLTFYTLQVLRRGLTAAEADSIAADYLGPAAPVMASGASQGFSYDEGAYRLASTTGTSVSFSLPLGQGGERWLDVFAVSGWRGSSTPAVAVGGAALQAGVDYLATVDPATSTAYVKLMRPLVAQPSNPRELGNGQIVIS